MTVIVSRIEYGLLWLFCGGAWFSGTLAWVEKFEDPIWVALFGIVGLLVGFGCYVFSAYQFIKWAMEWWRGA